MNKKQISIAGRRATWCFRIGIALVLAAVSAAATALPKGDCTDPRPYTDLSLCGLEGADLKNRDLRGTDLRVESLYLTDLRGANLADAIFDRDKLLLAQLDGAKGLPQDIVETLRIYALLNKNNYAVSVNRDSSIKLSPSKAASGVHQDIAGLANIQMVRKVEDRSQVIALLDWPRNSDLKGRVIVALFDGDRLDMPACYRGANLLDGDRYYYADWASLKVKPLTGGGYLIGVRASGSDQDGEGISGWDKVIFIKLSPACILSVLGSEDAEWGQGLNEDWCRGEHLNFRFLDEKTAELEKRSHACGENEQADISIKQLELN